MKCHSPCGIVPEAIGSHATGRHSPGPWEAHTGLQGHSDLIPGCGNPASQEQSFPRTFLLFSLGQSSASVLHVSCLRSVRNTKPPARYCGGIQRAEDKVTSLKGLQRCDTYTSNQCEAEYAGGGGSPGPYRGCTVGHF